MDCYGRQYNRLTECLACKERPWCRDAADPTPLGSPEAGPGGDGADYEAALATTPAPEPGGPAPTVGTDASAAVGELFSGLAIACDRNPDRIAAVVFRLAGLSYSEIGGLSTRDGGKSKQAVHKDVNRMATACPALGRVLRLRFHQTADLRAVPVRLAEEFRRRRPGAKLTGVGGLYAVLAGEYGLSERTTRRILAKPVDVGQTDTGTEGTAG